MAKKHCPFCLQTKSISDFYKHPSASDGCLNLCKECHKKRIRENRARRIEYYRQFDRNRGMLPHRVEARERYAKTLAGKVARSRAAHKWNQLNKVRKAASTLLNNAIKRGKVKRQTCFICGKKAHAHHPDYDRPLDVVWLCPLHHKQAHKESMNAPL